MQLLKFGIFAVIFVVWMNARECRALALTAVDSQQGGAAAATTTAEKKVLPPTSGSNLPNEGDQVHPLLSAHDSKGSIFQEHLRQKRGCICHMVCT